MSVHGWIYDKARRAPMRFNGYLPPRTSSSCTSSVYTRCNADLPRPCMAERDSPPPASTSDAIYVHGSVRHAVTCSGRMCSVMRVEMEDAHTHEQGNDETPTFARTFPLGPTSSPPRLRLRFLLRRSVAPRPTLLLVTDTQTRQLSHSHQS